MRECEGDYSRTALRNDLYARYNQLSEKFDNAKFKMGDYRLKISERETFLLQIFRELIGCDIHVSSNYIEKFNENKNPKEKDKHLPNEFFEVKLDTFWKPIKNVNGEQIEDAYVETDLTHTRFRKKINNLDSVPENKFYRFLPDSIST